MTQEEGGEKANVRAGLGDSIRRAGSACDPELKSAKTGRRGDSLDGIAKGPLTRLLKKKYVQKVRKSAGGLKEQQRG